MTTQFSLFGQHLARGSGIGELMDDLGHAMASGGKDILMLGGGQPARIPAMEEVWKRRLGEMMAVEDGLPAAALTCYDPPQGNPEFLRAVAGLLRREYGWDLSEGNVAVTSGGQTAFFMLFNLLAGMMPDGTQRHVLLPLAPEYIGYANQGVNGGLFRAARPRVEEHGNHGFKYRIDFDRLDLREDTSAICASRPTNPSGNVLTDEEIRRLSAMARAHGIPLIIDNAYGLPFPGIVFGDATPFWEPHVILTLSLSKIGLPATRTGIVVGPPEIIRAISSMNAIVGLANPGFGQQLTCPLIESGELVRLSSTVVREFYREKCELARQTVSEAFAAELPPGVPWRMHESEGALFLWLWFPGLPVHCQELYERLKRRGVLVIPGHHFFYGMDGPDWPHARECIRVSYAMDATTVRAGLLAIAQEVAAIHRGK